MNRIRVVYEWVLEDFDEHGDIIDPDHEEGRPDRLLRRYFDLIDAGERADFGVNRWEFEYSGFGPPFSYENSRGYEQFYCDENLKFGPDLPARKTKQRELDAALRRIGRLQ